MTSEFPAERLRLGLCCRPSSRSGSSGMGTRMRRALLCTMTLGAIEAVSACGGSTGTPPNDLDAGFEIPDGFADDRWTGFDEAAPDTNGPDAPDANDGGTDGSSADVVDTGPAFPDAALDATGADAAACDGQCGVSFASGPDWAAYDEDPATNADPHELGMARHVCLNATSPPNCPAGALTYGFAAGWGFSLASIPGAHWIWGPGVAATDVADLKRFYFVHRFDLGQRPSGWIS